MKDSVVVLTSDFPEAPSAAGPRDKDMAGGAGSEAYGGESVGGG